MHCKIKKQTMYFKKKHGKRSKSKKNRYNKEKSEALFAKISDELAVHLIGKSSFRIKLVGRPKWTHR